MRANWHLVNPFSHVENSSDVEFNHEFVSADAEAECRYCGIMLRDSSNGPCDQHPGALVLESIQLGLMKHGDDQDWDAPEFADARKLTEQLGCVWDFESWSATAATIRNYGTLGGVLLANSTWQIIEDSNCRDCGAPISHGEHFCADCDMRMDLGDSEYQNRIGENDNAKRD